MNCKGCIFAEMSQDDIQDGCKAGRLEIFIDLGKASLKGDAFSLQRFCNMYRSDEWKGLRKNQEEQDLLKSAKKESATSFGIVVFDNEEIIREQLEGTLQSIESLDYDPKKIQILINSFVGRGVDYIVQKVEELRSKGYHTKMMLHHELLSTAEKEKESFQKIFNNHYFVSTHSGDLIPQGFLKEIDKSINERAEIICAFQSGGTTAIPRYVVRNEYLNYNDYHLMVEGVIKASKEGGLFVEYKYEK